MDKPTFDVHNLWIGYPPTLLHLFTGYEFYLIFAHHKRNTPINTDIFVHIKFDADKENLFLKIPELSCTPDKYRYRVKSYEQIINIIVNNCLGLLDIKLYNFYLNCISEKNIECTEKLMLMKSESYQMENNPSFVDFFKNESRKVVDYYFEKKPEHLKYLQPNEYFIKKYLPLKLCPICYNEELVEVIFSCGHLVCRRCLEEMERKECPFNCNSHMIKIYDT